MELAFFTLLQVCSEECDNYEILIIQYLTPDFVYNTLADIVKNFKKCQCQQ